MNTLQIQIDKLTTSKDQDFIIVNNYRYKSKQIDNLSNLDKKLTVINNNLLDILKKY